MRKTIIYAVLCCALLIGGVVARAQNGNGVVGFAVCNSFGQNGVTGGGNGEVVHVSSRQELAKYAGSTDPYVIIIDNDIDGGGMNDLQDELSINSNKTIIGAGSGKKLNGIGLTASSKHNIIIRNIYLKKGRIDGVAFHNCHHVWIDHCDLSDSYDGLLDITNGSDFFTVSWVKLHDHNKVSITNSGTCHYEDYNKERVTFAHCMFKNNTQRNPRIGYGKMHIYNSYWELISSYCIGFHSQAQVLSENNYFSPTARHPFCNQYTDQLPYCGYLTDKGSYFANGNPGRSHNRPFTDISYSPLDYYEYSFDLDSAEDVAKNMPLIWCQAADAVKYKVYLSDNESSLDKNIIGETSSLSIVPASLSTGKKYYWRVDAVKSDGSVVKGDTWTFNPQGKKWHVGKNEAEEMFISGIAFLEKNESASNGGVVVGDQGPGAICGTWEGKKGRYAIETAVFNQKSGANYIGVTVNGKLIDEWLTSSANDDLGIRKTRNSVVLKPGDDIRIDFVAGLIEGKINESRSRIDYVNIVPTKEEFIEVTRPSGIHHSPMLTTGYNCEYLLLDDIIFTDSLGTIDDKGETQVRDKYCSWVSKTADGYKLYVKQTAIVKFTYMNVDGKKTEVVRELDKNVNNEVSISSTSADGKLYSIHLYKTQPAKTIYRKPVVESGKDYEIVWSKDVIIKDSDGIKGNPGKTQMRDGYDEWIKYVNPTANEVLAKKNPKAFIDPETDKECDGILPRLVKSSSYVVGTDKTVTYCLQGCSRIKFYYTGSGGSSTIVKIKATNLSTGEEQIIEGAPAPGKNVASNTAEVKLDPQCRYDVTISGTTGDMVIYAVKLLKFRK